MAKLTNLISCCAETTGVPEPTIREISRWLRNAKLIGTGTGGRYGGADMTARDAASLLTGLLIASAESASIRNISSLVKSYLKLRSHSPRERGILGLGSWKRELELPLLYDLGRGHTFEEAFTALVASSANGDLERAARKWADGFVLGVKIFRPRPRREAEIYFDIGSKLLLLAYAQPKGNLFQEPAPRKWSDALSRASGYDLQVQATIQQETIAAIGGLLAEEAS
jgi:hypothetical protein